MPGQRKEQRKDGCPDLSRKDGCPDLSVMICPPYQGADDRSESAGSNRQSDCHGSAAFVPDRGRKKGKREGKKGHPFSYRNFMGVLFCPFPVLSSVLSLTTIEILWVSCFVHLSKFYGCPDLSYKERTPIFLIEILWVSCFALFCPMGVLF